MVRLKSQRLAVSALLASSLLGCSGRRGGGILDTVKRYQDRKIVIGRLDRLNLEFLDFEKASAAGGTSVPHDGYRRIGIAGASSQMASDGRVAMCDARLCSITDPGSKATHIIFSSNHVVTPLYWSPDGRLLLFVRDIWRFRIPPRCGFDLEHEVVIYEPSTGNELIAATVCGGYPYRELGWYSASD